MVEAMEDSLAVSKSSGALCKEELLAAIAGSSKEGGEIQLATGYA